MTLYLDASALVKRYVAEEGSDEVREAMDGGAWAMCRLGFVETIRAIRIAGEKAEARRFEREWAAFYIVEVDTSLTRRAAELADRHRLRTLDALHLAAALCLPFADLVFVTWDRRLHEAARAEDLAVLPETLA